MANDKLVVRTPRRRHEKSPDPDRPPDFDHANFDNKLVADLVRVARATADFLSDPQGVISKSLVEGLVFALRNSANRVGLYVLESPGAITDAPDPTHALYVLRKELKRLEQQEQERRVIASVKQVLR